MYYVILEKSSESAKKAWETRRRGLGKQKPTKKQSEKKSEAESLARAKRIIAKYPTWESYHESQKGTKYKDFIGRTQVVRDAEHDKRNSRYMWEAAKQWVDAGGSPAKKSAIKWDKTLSVAPGGKGYFYTANTPRGRVWVVWDRVNKKWKVDHDSGKPSHESIKHERFKTAEEGLKAVAKWLE